jgi:hypothetical protein
MGANVAEQCGHLCVFEVNGPVRRILLEQREADCHEASDPLGTSGCELQCHECPETVSDEGGALDAHFVQETAYQSRLPLDRVPLRLARALSETVEV